MEPIVFEVEDRLPVKSFLRPLIGNVYTPKWTIELYWEVDTGRYSSRDLSIKIRRYIFENREFMAVEFINICGYNDGENITESFYKCLDELEIRYAKYWNNRGALKPMRVQPLYQLIENSLICRRDVRRWKGYRVEIRNKAEGCHISVFSDTELIFYKQGVLKHILRCIMRDMDNGTAPISFYSSIKGSKSARS